MLTLKKYKDFVDKDYFDRINELARPLKDKHVVHISSTYHGGGVAEMLSSLVPLMNCTGMHTGWRLLKGNPDFFGITKKFHNALQGEKINFSKRKRAMYEEINKNNSVFTHLNHHDCVIVHDPQPLAIINNYHKRQPWIWRCHIDLSNPDKEVWNYLNQFVTKYDRVIISKDTFKRKNNVPQTVVYPAIDPLNTKHEEISLTRAKMFVKKFGIELNKPIISQISRFDKWKDPLGVIKAFRKIRKEVDCKLVLLGSMATDDPEGQKVYHEVIEQVKNDKDIHVINYSNDFLVNSLQRVSSVVIQKSLREGFGLTVSEALWKKTPVVASNVGGIHLQIKNGYNGYLINSIDSCASSVIKILKNPELGKKMGERGREMVREKFLITRQLEDYLKILRQQIIHYKV